MTEQDKNQQSAPLPSMTERNPERHRLKRRKEFLIGTVVAVCLLAAGAGVIRYFVAKNQPAANSATVDAEAGLIDWQQVIEAHPDFGYTINPTIIATTDGAYQPALDAALQAGGDQQHAAGKYDEHGDDRAAQLPGVVLHGTTMASSR